MGDKVLKKITLLITLSCLLFAAENAEEKSADLTWVDQEIAAIKPPRKGVSIKAISLLKDQFIFLEKNRKKKKKKQGTSHRVVPSVIPSSGTTHAVAKKKSVRRRGLRLMAIMNNTALINGKWYKLGDHVGRYKIVKISLDEVRLKSATKSVVLTTHTNKLKQAKKLKPTKKPKK